MRSVSTRLDPMLWPSAARKVKTIPPPMRRLSARSMRLSITPSLSETLEPPRTTVNGGGGIVEQPIADLDLGPDERARVVRQEGGDVEHRGLLAVDDAESVGDEVIGQLGQLT